MKTGEQENFEPDFQEIEGMTPEQINQKMREQIEAGEHGEAVAPAIEPEEPSHRSVDLAAMLGDGEPAGEENGAEEPAQAAEEPAAPAEETPAEPASDMTAMQARLEELAEANRHFREQNDLLTRKLLGDDVNPAGEDDDVFVPDGMAPETARYLQPLLKPLQQKITELESRVQPVLQKSQGDALVDHLVQSVEGFDASMMPKLREEFGKLSEADQQRYGRDELGAEVVAQKVVRAAGGGARRPTNPTHKAQMQTDLGGGAQTTQTDVRPEKALDKMNSMSDEEFEKLMARTDSELY